MWNLTHTNTSSCFHFCILSERLLPSPSSYFCSVSQSCLTLCDPTDCSLPGSSVLHCLPEVTCWETLVLWRVCNTSTAPSCSVSLLVSSPSVHTYWRRAFMRRFQTVCLEMSFVSHSNFCLLCLILYFCCCSHSAGVFGLSFSFWWQFQVECLFVQTSGSTMFNRLSRERELGSIKIMKKESESEVAQSCPTLCNPMDCSYQAPLSMGFSSKSTGVSCHCLLQGIFPIQESNLGLLPCRQILYWLSYEGR